MVSRLPQIKPKELIRILESFGFVVRRQTGSHCILKHPAKQKIVSAPVHSGDIKRGLLFGILKQAEISQEEFAKSV